MKPRPPYTSDLELTIARTSLRALGRYLKEGGQAEVASWPLLATNRRKVTTELGLLALEGQKPTASPYLES